jgi:hypothetical protein
MENATETLIQSWKKCPQDIPFCLPEDNLKKENYYDYQGFKGLLSEIEKGELDRKKFHVSLVPKPYIGDIKNAKIYILMLNPGFIQMDIKSEEMDKDLKEAFIKNLHQDFTGVEYPLVFLDPRFQYHGGGMYWLKRLKPLIEKLQEKNDNYIENLKLLAKNICIVQTVPYHSIEFDSSIKDLKSTTLITNTIKELTQKKDKLFIVIRGKEIWKLALSTNVKECLNRAASIKNLTEVIIDCLVHSKI